MISSDSSPQLRTTMSLDGNWSFVLDSDDIGEQEGWYRKALENSIKVPASWAEEGYGEAPTNRYIWGWNAQFEYEGVGWYTREIEIPSDWSGKQVELTLSGVRWRSRVWLDGNYIGECDALSVSHHHDLSKYIQVGQRQRLSIQIDNRMIYPLEEGHINSLQTATRWGGITGGIEISARSHASIQTVTCQPDIANKAFAFDVQLSEFSDGMFLQVRVSHAEDDVTIEVEHSINSTGFGMTVELGEQAHLWTDDDPYLYDIQFVLVQNGTAIDSLTKRGGLREISVSGKQVLLNGHPVFLRGYVDCCIFPLTGYPSWDIEHYRRQFEIAKSYGFNHVRLHSWSPPPPFWDAADEFGMLVQTELPHWSKHYITGDSIPPEATHRFLTDEMVSIINSLSFNPSWVMFACGNELINPEGHSKLNELIVMGKSLDETRLFTDQTGTGRLPAPQRKGDFFVQSCNWHPPKKIYDAASNDTTQDFDAITALSDRPLIGHEHGQFTMYVRPVEAGKYTGPIRPTWLESVEESFNVKGLSDQVDDFIQASGIHIVRTYKENIERARRTADLAGFQLLDIRDFPGQAHATTGILDMFWDSKGLVEPNDFTDFNGSAVLLMRCESPTVYQNDGIRIDIELSNYRRDDISGTLQWTLTSDHQQHHGEMDVPVAKSGQLTSLGQLTIGVDADAVAREWILTLRLGNIKNTWNLWTYPYPSPREPKQLIRSRIDSFRHLLPHADYRDDYGGHMLTFDRDDSRLDNSTGLAIADLLSLRLLQYLHNGGDVWFMPTSDQIYDSVHTRYLPPFWSYLHFPDNVSSVMGMIIHDHCVLQNFPNDGYSNWQWYSLVNDTPAIALDAIPSVQPIVEVVDNFNRAKRLAYAFSAQVGDGRLFVTTWRLNDPSVIGRPEATYLFNQIIDYLTGDNFTPDNRLSVAQLLSLFKLTNNRTSILE